MLLTKDIPAITVPVTHYGQNNVTTFLPISFEIFLDENRFRAVPRMTREERIATGLPAELQFVYRQRCIVSANDMSDDTLEVIKRIILELEEQEFPGMPE